MEIKLPGELKQCTPEQMAKWLLLTESVGEARGNLNRSLDFQCQVLSIFTGLTMNQIRKCHIDDVTEAALILLQMLSSYKIEEPSDVLVIEGKRYIFEKDPALWSTGQIIDLKLIEEVSSTPHEALAIMYVEESMTYCQEDDRGKVLNPNKNREEVFKRSFPGDEFMNFFYFFFFDSEKRKNAISGIQIARMMIQKEKILESLSSETVNGLPGQSFYSGLQKRWVKMWTR